MSVETRAAHDLLLAQLREEEKEKRKEIAYYQERIDRAEEDIARLWEALPAEPEEDREWRRGQLGPSGSIDLRALGKLMHEIMVAHVFATQSSNGLWALCEQDKQSRASDQGAKIGQTLTIRLPSSYEVQAESSPSDQS